VSSVLDHESGQRSLSFPVTFVYDEEPFGYALNFEKRQEEFFKRYLWTTAMTSDMKILEKKKVTVAGVKASGCRRRTRPRQEGEGQIESGLRKTRGTRGVLVPHPVEADRRPLRRLGLPSLRYLLGSFKYLKNHFTKPCDLSLNWPTGIHSAKGRE